MSSSPLLFCYMYICTCLLTLFCSSFLLLDFLVPQTRGSICKCSSHYVCKPSKVAKMSVKPIWRKNLNLCNTSNNLNESLPTPMPDPLIPHHEPSQENNHPNQALPNPFIKDSHSLTQVTSHPPSPISPITSQVVLSQTPSHHDNQTQVLP